MAYQGTILANSPFYITEAGVGGYTSTLNIRIWNGLLSAEPVSATYTIVKQAVSSVETNVTFEISKLLSDFPETLGNIYDISDTDNETTWYVSVKSTGGTTNRDDHYIFTNGYTNFLDGINYGLDQNPVLMKTDTIYIPDENTDDISIPIYYSQDGNKVTTIVSHAFDGTTSNTDITETSDDSALIIQHISIPSQVGGRNTVKLSFEYSGTDFNTDITIERVICNAHGNIQLLFENSYGVLESAFFFGNTQRTSDIKKDDYKTQLVYNNSGTATYDVTKHQYNTYNVTGIDKIKINSGVVKEEFGLVIREIMNSSKIWLILDDILTPVTLDTKNIQYISDFNSKIVNYSLKFSYAFNTQNLVY